ncbi:hypothetical protein L6164_028487 [Bauhinia variegata]|uniref:Uncharacterized protein n=1 Tax=Bauhinia variegata TaxID=167791 RepID=A0ACB9L7M4_BAUVA|nr:hypothetical protein L6164_028487 [Bauhinia variegata]
MSYLFLYFSLAAQVPQYSVAQFTEEFDFEAMNVKFKKDEIWGSHGKATEKIVVEDNASVHSLGILMRHFCFAAATTMQTRELMKGDDLTNDEGES